MTSFKGLVFYARDISNSDEGQFSLAAFVAGPNAAEWTKLDSLKKERALLEHITLLVGSKYEGKVYNVLEINPMT